MFVLGRGLLIVAYSSVFLLTINFLLAVDFIVRFSFFFTKVLLPLLSCNRSSWVVPPQIPNSLLANAHCRHWTLIWHVLHTSLATTVDLLLPPSGKNKSVGMSLQAAFVTSNIALLICRPYIRIVFWFCTCIFWPIKLTVPFVVFCQ